MMLGVPEELIRLLVAISALAGFVGLSGMVLVYLERKIAGHIQQRPGPFEVGPHGILQPVADAAKLVAKQLFTLAGADKWLFWAAPVLSFLPVFVLFLPIPWGEGLYPLATNVGLILILAFAGLNVIALLLAGWASGNKWGVLGAARAVAQSVGYEIPLLLSVLAIAFMHGSLDLRQIAAEQGPWPWQWNAVLQPVAFFIYIVCALAETNRAPFDLPEAESELTAGFHTEYSGMGFGLFFLAEYANMIVVSAVAATLFLGGWQGPVFGGPWWLLLKVYGVLIFMMWVRWTYPRTRFDQLLNLCWKWLIPLAILNLLGTAALMKLL